VVALHDRSVLMFGQSTRRYIVRIFPKNVSSCVDPEEANTVLNCMVSYKQQSPPRASDLEMPAKLERRVSFSCLAPEIIPSHPSVKMAQDVGSTTPMSVMDGSPEVSWLRKSLPGSPRLSIQEFEPYDMQYSRSQSDSLPSIQPISGSDEEDENTSSFESLELSPVLGTIDEMREIIPEQRLAPTRRKTFFKRLPAKLEAFTKRVRPDA